MSAAVARVAESKRLNALKRARGFAQSRMGMRSCGATWTCGISGFWRIV